MEVLESCKIGRLSDADAARAQSEEDAYNANATREHGLRPSSRAVARAKWRSAKNTAKVWCVGLCYPAFLAARFALRAIGYAGYYFGGWHFASFLSKLLPISVRGYRGHLPLAAVDPATGRRGRVAVVGGGISGVGCAYTLRQGGYEVVIYEARDKLGGNAQTATFEVNGKQITQDLSVCFWAPEYYKNYMSLLKEIGVKVRVMGPLHRFIATSRYHLHVVPPRH